MRLASGLIAALGLVALGAGPGSAQVVTYYSPVVTSPVVTAPAALRTARRGARGPNPISSTLAPRSCRPA